MDWAVNLHDFMGSSIGIREAGRGLRGALGENIVATAKVPTCSL